MSDENKTVVRRIVEDHWNKKNAALVSELFASNVALDTPDGMLTGLEGASLLLQAYQTIKPRSPTSASSSTTCWPMGTT
jgi:hypothetical protein